MNEWIYFYNFLFSGWWRSPSRAHHLQQPGARPPPLTQVHTCLWLVILAFYWSNLAFDWSILTILASDWSNLASNWSILTILASDWSYCSQYSLSIGQVPVRHPAHLPGRGQARRHRGWRHPGGGHVQQEDQGHVRRPRDLDNIITNNHCSSDCPSIFNLSDCDSCGIC